MAFIFLSNNSYLNLCCNIGTTLRPMELGEAEGLPPQKIPSFLLDQCKLYRGDIVVRETRE